MISIHIEADSAHAAIKEVLALAAGLSMGTPVASSETPAEEKKPATRKSTKASAEGNAAASGTAASSGTADTQASGSTTSSSGQTATTAASPSEEITRATVEPKCMAYSQKGGAQALKELFIEMGSPAGKWSAIPDDKLPALNARLDELLAG